VYFGGQRAVCQAGPQSSKEKASASAKAFSQETSRLNYRVPVVPVVPVVDTAVLLLPLVDAIATATAMPAATAAIVPADMPPTAAPLAAVPPVPAVFDEDSAAKPATGIAITADNKRATAFVFIYFPFLLAVERKRLFNWKEVVKLKNTPSHRSGAIDSWLGFHFSKLPRGINNLLCRFCASQEPPPSSCTENVPPFTALHGLAKGIRKC